MIDLTKWRYFNPSEFLYSRTAVEHGIDNSPKEYEWVMDNLNALVVDVLDPIRERMGCPIIVNSGFRCAQLNRLVGGSLYSQHMYGEAADITCSKASNNQAMFNYIQSMRLPFDQLIEYDCYDFLHVSHKRIGYNRHQVLHVDRRSGKFWEGKR